MNIIFRRLLIVIGISGCAIGIAFGTLEIALSVSKDWAMLFAGISLIILVFVVFPSWMSYWNIPSAEDKVNKGD